MSLNLSSHRVQTALITIGILLLGSSGIAYIYFPGLFGRVTFVPKTLYRSVLYMPNLSRESLKKIPDGFPSAFIFGIKPEVEWGKVVPPPSPKNSVSANSLQAGTQYKVSYITPSDPASLVREWKAFFARTKWIMLREESTQANIAFAAKHFEFDLERLVISITPLNGGASSRVIITYVSRFSRAVSSPSVSAYPK